MVRLVTGAESQGCSTSARIRAQLIGKLRFWRHDCELSLSRPAREILCLLLLRGSADRSWLASTIWPESEPDRAQFYLRRVLWEITGAAQLASRWYRSRRGTLELIQECFTSDWYELRSAIDMVDLALAASLATDDFAVEFDHHEVARTRADLRDELRALLRLNSHRADAENTPAIQRLFARLFERLRVEPDPQASGKSAQALPWSGAILPIPLTEIVGRDQLLAKALLDLEQSRLVTLTGAGGIGKTRMALELSSILAKSQAGPPLYVELAHVRSSEGVIHAILSAIGLTCEAGQTPRGLWADVVGSRPALVILDNAEELSEEVGELIQYSLLRCPNLRFLVTSRVPLRLSGEKVRRLPPLGKTFAEQLLRQRLRLVSDELPTEAEAQAACEVLDGLPLAIEIFAASADSLPLSARMDLLRLGFPAKSADGRHGSLRSLLQTSLRMLDLETRRAFFRLSVFVGGLTAEAAREVAGLETEGLALLVSKSLVEFDGTRYRLLEPIRQLCREELGEEIEDIAKRHAEYFHQLALRAYDGPFLYDRDPKLFREQAARLKLEEHNMAAAEAWFAEEVGPTSDARLSIYLCRAWHRTLAQPHLATERETAIWKNASLSKSAVMIEWLFALGSFSVWQDNWQDGTTLLEQVIEFGPLKEGHHLAVLAHIQLANMMLVDKQPEKMYHHLEAAKVIALEANLSSLLIFVEITLLDALLRDERYSEARELEAKLAPSLELRKSPYLFPLFQRARSRLPENDTWLRRKQLLEEALAAQELTGHWAKTHTLNALAVSANRYGERSLFTHYKYQLLDVARRDHDTGMEAATLIELAQDAFESADHARAFDFLATALEGIQLVGRRVFLLTTLAIAAAMLAEAGFAEEAAGIRLLIQEKIATGELPEATLVERKLASFVLPPEIKPMILKSASDACNSIRRVAHFLTGNLALDTNAAPTPELL